MVRRANDGAGDGESSAVKVFVRVRPHNQREKDAAAKKGEDLLSIIHMADKKVEVMCTEKHTPKHTFSFDGCLWSIPPEDVKRMRPVPKCNPYLSQQAVFQECGLMMVNNSLEGYNSCLFAYGQTGSGKTFTMMGKRGDATFQGIIPRLCADLFQRTMTKKDMKYKVKISYLEIYNEMVRDLLVEKRRDGSLRVRQDPTTGTYVEDLSCHEVASQEAVFKWMERGDHHRATAETKMNQASSRSHAIFTLSISQFSQDDAGADKSKSAKLHLVDLAGSERVNLSGAEGSTFKEATKINLSLTNLGRVIDALADLANNVKSVFPPYRDSMLTWILSDSLGGNSKTAMIATVSPSELNIDETLNTLRYASRAREIVNIAVVNEDSSVAKIKELEARVEYLRKQLREAGGTGIKHRLQDLEDTINYQQGVIQKLEKEKDTLTKEKKDRLLKQSARRDNDADAIKKLEAKAKKKQKEMGDIKEDFTTLKEEHRATVEKLAQVEKKLTDNKKKLKEQKEAWERELADIIAQRDSLQKDDTATKKKEKKNQEHIKDLEAQVEKLEREAQGADELNAELMDEKDAADEQIEELKQQVEDLKMNLEKKEASLETAKEFEATSSPRLAKYETEIESLQRRLDNAAQSRATMVERLNEMKESQHSLETEKSRLERETESLTLKLSVAEDEKEEVAEELKQEKADHDATKARKEEFLRAQKAVEEQVEQLQNQLLSADEKIAQYKMTTEAEKAKIASLEEQLASMQDEASTYETQALEAQSDLREAEDERTKLFDQLQALEKDAKEKQEKAEATVAKLKEEADRQYSRADTAEGEVTELEGDLATLRAKLEESAEKEKELHLSLAGIKRRYDEHVAASAGEHEALEARIAELQTKLAAEEDKLAAASKQHDALQSTHSALEKTRQEEGAAATAKVKDLDAAIEALKRDVAERDSTIADERQEGTRLRDTVAQREADIEALKGTMHSDKEAATAAHGDVSAKLAASQAEVGRLTEGLEGKTKDLDAANASIQSLEQRLADTETSGAAAQKTMNSQLQAANDTVAEREQKIAALETSLETTTAQLRESEAEGTRDKAFATAQANDLQAEIASLKADLAKTKQSLETSTVDYERTAQELAESKMKVGELSTEVKAVQSTLVDTKAAAEGESEKASTRMHEKNAEIARLQKSLDEEKAVLNATIEQRVALDAKLRDAESAALKAAETSSGEIAQRDATIGKKESIIADLEKAVQNKCDDIEGLKAQGARDVAALNTAAERLNGELNEKLAELERTKADLEEVRSTYATDKAAYATAVKAFEERVAGLERDVSERNVQIEALTTERDHSNASNKQQREELEQLEVRRASEEAEMKARIAELEKKNETEAAAAAAKEEELSAQIAELTMARDDLSGEKASLVEKVRVLEETTVPELQSDVMTARSELSQRVEQLTEMKAKQLDLEVHLKGVEEKLAAAEGDLAKTRTELSATHEAEHSLEMRKLELEQEVDDMTEKMAMQDAELKAARHDRELAEHAAAVAELEQDEGAARAEVLADELREYLPLAEGGIHSAARNAAIEEMAMLQEEDLDEIPNLELTVTTLEDENKRLRLDNDRLNNMLHELRDAPSPIAALGGASGFPSSAGFSTKTPRATGFFNKADAKPAANGRDAARSKPATLFHDGDKQYDGVDEYG